MEEKNNVQDNLFYYFIPMSISKDLLGEAFDLNIKSEYLKGNVISILDQCKYIKSSFNLFDFLEKQNIENEKIDFNNIEFIESSFYSFINLDIKDKKNNYAKLKYLVIKVKYELSNIDAIAFYNRIIFKTLSKIDNYFTNNKLKEINIDSECKYYKPRVLSFVLSKESIDGNFDYFSSKSNLLSNASKDEIIKTKTERIHKDTLYSTSIRGANIIKDNNNNSFMENSFENNYKSLFLLALNQIMICEYENEKVTEEIKKYNYKKTDNKNIDKIIINIRREIATYFFDVTTNVTNINLFYRDLLVNFVLEPSQKELMENVEILNSLVNKNMERRRNWHDFFGKMVLGLQAIALVILAILQVVQDEVKNDVVKYGLITGGVILVLYAIYHLRGILR